jgi:hypothetical protein
VTGENAESENASRFNPDDNELSKTDAGEASLLMGGIN